MEGFLTEQRMLNAKIMKIENIKKKFVHQINPVLPPRQQGSSLVRHVSRNADSACTFKSKLSQQFVTLTCTVKSANKIADLTISKARLGGSLILIASVQC